MLKLIIPIVSLVVALLSVYMNKSVEKSLEDMSARHYQSLYELRKEDLE